MNEQKQNNKDIYISKGFKDRNDYLDTLADDMGVDRKTVDMIADMLGESEDFDGLVSALEDYQDW